MRMDGDRSPAKAESYAGEDALAGFLQRQDQAGRCSTSVDNTPIGKMNHAVCLANHPFVVRHDEDSGTMFI